MGKLFKAFWYRLKASNTFKVALGQIVTAAGAYVTGTISGEAFIGTVVFALLQFVQREVKLRKEDDSGGLSH